LSQWVTSSPRLSRSLAFVAANTFTPEYCIIDLQPWP
jgi:hypothetical protein